jgi:hypothetical protein
MQTQMKKILIGAAALIFLFSGVSFANNRGSRHHKPQGKAHGVYKEKNQQHGDHRHFKPREHSRKGHTYKDVRKRHYSDKHPRHWKKSHAKFRRNHHDQYRYRKIRQHHRNSHHRRSPRENLIYKAVFKDPGMVFKVILNQK